MTEKIIDLIPKHLKLEIQEHIRKSSLRGEQGWKSSHEDEDSITGDFFGSLRNGLNKSDGFSWEITYNKFDIKYI